MTVHHKNMIAITIPADKGRYIALTLRTSSAGNKNKKLMFS